MAERNHLRDRHQLHPMTLALLNERQRRRAHAIVHRPGRRGRHKSHYRPLRISA
jgi:hypothetical protein